MLQFVKFITFHIPFLLYILVASESTFKVTSSFSIEVLKCDWGVFNYIKFSLSIGQYHLLIWLGLNAFLPNAAFRNPLGISHPEVFCKKGVLKNFAKVTGKHLCQSLFFNKVASVRPCHRWFSVNSAKSLRTPVFKNHLQWLLLPTETFREPCIYLTL